jgi:hypothetical protein
MGCSSGCYPSCPARKEKRLRSGACASRYFTSGAASGPCKRARSRLVRSSRSNPHALSSPLCCSTCADTPSARRRLASLAWHRKGLYGITLHLRHDSTGRGAARTTPSADAAIAACCFVGEGVTRWLRCSIPDGAINSAGVGRLHLTGTSLLSLLHSHTGGGVRTWPALAEDHGS